MGTRLADFRRALTTLGGSVQEPNNGSHWKACFGEKMYPIPAHNGLKTDLSDRWVDGACRRLGIDKATLRALL